MTSSKLATGHPRPGSSRATSVAQEILKRRDKPYRTEHQRIIQKRKKLQLYTSFTRAPPGQTFVAVGTPDLYERCKELSRQRGLAARIVNADPVSKNAKNPDKISYHIHRIGYHFATTVVEQACEELGYVFHRNHFIKEADLQAQYQQSHTARILAQHGIRFDQPSTQETPAQIRGVIKELYPDMPEDDCEAIIEHAWEKGTDRVGTNMHLSLPRRIQLATIARIRHHHTDYDRLLRAFDWASTREIVEQECLKKLIEWRGDNDANDEDLEEIVRETIVIDDDDDEHHHTGAPYKSEADDEDSDLEVIDTSDASIRFTHHVLADDDTAAEESVDERSKPFLQRFQPRSLRIEQQNEIARQKLDAARQQMRLGPSAAPSSAIPVTVQSDARGLPPNTIVVDGTVYHLAGSPSGSRPETLQQPQPYQRSQYAPRPLSDQYQANPVYPAQFNRTASGGHVLPSIEPYTPVLAREPYQPAYPEPKTPDRQHANKRRRVHNPGVSSMEDVEVIDLTTPDQRNRSTNPSPRDGLAGSSWSDPHSRPFNDTSRHQPPSPGRPQRYQISEMPPEPYDPTQPLLPVHRQDAPRNAYPPSAPYQETFAPDPRAMPPPSQYQYPAPTQYLPLQPPPGVRYLDPYAKIMYPAAPAPVQHMTPQPVHGAPAPVQQVPRTEVPGHGTSGSEYRLRAPQTQPVDGAPHPAQYYYSR